MNMRAMIVSVAAGVTGMLAVAVGAQSGAGRMPSHADHGMEMAKAVTYTGCLESDTTGAGTFVLTHPAMMDSAKKDAMKKDAMMKDSAKMDTMAAHDMSDHNMMSMMLTVSTTGLDLHKHLGQKVSVTGSLTQGMKDAGTDQSTLTVKSLKTIAKSCM
jgi:hypothetical protein